MAEKEIKQKKQDKPVQQAPASAEASAGRQDEEAPKIPSFKPGDTIKVSWRIQEEGKERTQLFEGVVIAIKGAGISKTFTVRKIASQGIGVERIFPLHSPNIQKVAVTKKGKARRAKLYYLREKVGKKATRVKGTPKGAKS